MITAFKRRIKRFVAAFSFLWKPLLRLAYRRTLRMDDKEAKRAWFKRLWYLRQWAHPPRPIGIAVYDVASVDGLRLTVSLNETSGGHLYYGMPSLDAPEINFLKKIIRTGDTVFDIGANIGYYGLIAAKKVGPAGMVYMFEPASATRKILEENIRLNGISNAKISNCAFGDNDGEKEIFLNSQSGLASFNQTFRGSVIGSEIVKCVTLDKFIGEHAIDRIDFLKIDVEGFEPEVLRGGKNFLNNRRGTIIMAELDGKNLSPSDRSAAFAINFMKNLGYEALLINRRSRCLEFAGPENEKDGINFVFARRNDPRFREMVGMDLRI